MDKIEVHAGYKISSNAKGVPDYKRLTVWHFNPQTKALDGTLKYALDSKKLDRRERYDSIIRFLGHNQLPVPEYQEP